jgi:UDP-2,4-diacetamido-2,4,6-trideoxy-beta-L-altropyranose hydrolase
MNVAFRVDASRSMGSGHVARCMALADEMRARGAATRFVSRSMPSHLRALLSERRHEVVDLPIDVGADEDPEDAWSAHEQAADAQHTLARLAPAGMPALVIVDHYGLDRVWEDAVRGSGARLMAIDDKGRPHRCDLLLDQNLHANMEARYSGKLPSTCRPLLGPTYALLRVEFRRLHQQVQPRQGNIERVFALFGGSDPYDLTSRAVHAIYDCGGELAADIVIGAEHPNRSYIASICAEYGYSYHMQTPRVAELMAAADVAFGAGGSSSWERCCLGLPTICVAFADNQIEIAAALAEQGVCEFLGDRNAATRSNMTEALNRLRATPEQLREMSAKAFDLVDGLGCVRVCDALAALS